MVSGFLISREFLYYGKRERERQGKCSPKGQGNLFLELVHALPSFLARKEILMISSNVLQNIPHPQLG